MLNVITKGSLSWELIIMASSLEKMMFTHVVPTVFSRKPEDMTYFVNTYFVYLRREALERPLVEIPTSMVLVTWCKTMLAISRKREMLGSEWKMWAKLVLPSPAVGATVLVKKVQGAGGSPASAERLRDFSMCITIWVVMAFSQWREDLYDGSWGCLKDQLMWGERLCYWSDL